jgi:hypothetical protein
MSLVTGGVTTYERVGNREDLTDEIYNISPTDTPFVQRAARVKAKARDHEWQTDSLLAAAANAHIEGDDTTVTTVTPTARLKNKSQIFKKSAGVSGTQEVVDKAGRNSEMAYLLMKVGKEIKRDIEFALTANTASKAGDVASARTLGSTISWINTNFTVKSSGSTATTTGGFNSSTGLTVAWIMGTDKGTFIEGDLKAVVQGAWTQGGQPDVILCAATEKKKISGFTGIADITKEAGNTAKATRIIGGADVYVSDFGEHRVVPSRFCAANIVQVLDMEYWAVAQLRGMTKERLAKTGDAERFHLVTELTLESRQEAASGLVVGVNGALSG